MQHPTKTAIVLGANGFVGNAVATAFSHDGYKVYGVIRDQKHASKLALEEIIPIIGTLNLTNWVDKVDPVDVIVNCTQDTDNLEEWITGLLNTVTKLSEKQEKNPLFIFTSGQMVFGDTGRVGESGFHSINEESEQHPLPVCKFRAPFIEKLFANEEFYTAVVIPGMIYGKSQSLYSLYIRQAAQGNKIVSHGKPETVFHGIHVDDVADVYVRIANLREKAHRQSYLAANDKYETVGDILKAISKQFGGHHEIVYEKPKGDETGLYESTSVWMDNGKIKRELGWLQRKPNFVDGIEQYVTAWKAYNGIHEYTK